MLLAALVVALPYYLVLSSSLLSSSILLQRLTVELDNLILERVGKSGKGSSVPE